MKKFMKFVTLVLVVATLSALCIATFVACGDKDNTGNPEAKNLLTVATEAKFAPYEYVENGKYVGFDMELIDAVAKKMGYDGVAIKDVEFDAVVTLVQGDKNTVGIAAMTINPTRLKAVNFSDAYLSEAYQVLVYNKSNTLFANAKTKEDILKVIADNKLTVNYAMGQTGQYYVEGNEAMKYPEVVCGKKASQKDAPSVKNSIIGNAVGVVDNAVAAEFCEADSNLAYIDVALTYENYGIAINKANTEMVTKVNEALAALKADGTIKNLLVKYGIVAAN